MVSTVLRETDAPVPLPGPEHRGMLSAGLVIVVTFAAVEALAVATILPKVRDDIGGTAFYGWAFSAFLLASIVGLTWAGELADRRGPALPFAAGLGVFAAGLVVAGLAPSMAVVAVGRALQGFGAGAIPTVAYVVIGRAYEPERRARMFAYLSSAWVVPGLVGPGLAALVVEVSSWRVVFLGLLIPLAAVVPLVLPSLRRLGPPQPAALPPSRLIPSALTALTAGLVLGGVSLASGGRPEGLLVAAAGTVAAIPPLRRVLPEGAARLRAGLPALVVSNAFLNLSFFGAEAYMPLGLADLRGQPPIMAGAALSVASVTWTAGTWLVERRPRLQDQTKTVPAGLALIALGIGIAGMGMVEPLPVMLTPAGWAVAGFGMGISYPNLSLALLRTAPESEQGAATASLKVGEYLGPALGIGVAGGVIAVASDGGWLGAAIGWTMAASAAGSAVAAIAARRSS